MGTSDKVNYINKTVGKFVDKFVLNFEAEASSILATEENDEENDEKIVRQLNMNQMMEFLIMPVGYYHVVYFPGIFRMLPRKEMGNVFADYGNFLCYTSRPMDEPSMYWKHST